MKSVLWTGAVHGIALLCMGAMGSDAMRNVVLRGGAVFRLQTQDCLLTARLDGTCRVRSHQVDHISTVVYDTVVYGTGLMFDWHVRSNRVSRWGYRGATRLGIQPGGGCREGGGAD